MVKAPPGDKAPLSAVPVNPRPTRNAGSASSTRLLAVNATAAMSGTDASSNPRTSPKYTAAPLPAPRAGNRRSQAGWRILRTPLVQHYPSPDPDRRLVASRRRHRAALGSHAKRVTKLTRESPSIRIQNRGGRASIKTDGCLVDTWASNSRGGTCDRERTGEGSSSTPGNHSPRPGSDRQCRPHVPLLRDHPAVLLRLVPALRGVRG